MIATILKGSAGFNAVRYNERKVGEGTAELIEMRGFQETWPGDFPTADDLVAYLKAYSTENPYIKDAQFHVAISCKGDEMTEEQLLDFAHRYLKEMGYYEDDQPILIYAHHDTANLHLHVITSRVGPDGRKINHHHERRRSQAVLNKLLGIDSKQEAEKSLEKAFGYRFSSLTQFKAILESLGYESYKNGDRLNIKRGGAVQYSVPLAEIEQRYVGLHDTYREIARLRALFYKYRDVSTSRSELVSELKRNFGYDLIFFGKKDVPYGYMVVDHAAKRVYSGQNILKAAELLEFVPIEERLERIDAYLDSIFETNPKITLPELNYKLRRQCRAKIDSQGNICYRDTFRTMKRFMFEALRLNGRIHRAESFCPTTEQERRALCRFMKIPDCSRVELSSEAPSRRQNLRTMMDRIFGNDEPIYRQLSQEDVYIVENDGDFFAIDLANKTLLNLTAEGYDVSRLRLLKREPVRKPVASLSSLNVDSSSTSEAREWEVGTNDRYDDYQLKM